MLTRRTRVSQAAAVVLAAGVLAAGMLAAAALPGADPVAAVPADALKQIIDESNPADLTFATPAEREQLGKLYATNGYRLLWSDGRQPTAAAAAMLAALRDASDRGLEAEDYAGGRLTSLLSSLTGAPHAGIEQWALFDAGLSMAGIHFLSDLHYGRIDPASVGHNLTVERIRLDIGAALVRIAGAADVPAAIDALEPQFFHYVLLKRQLGRYRALARDARLSDLPPLAAKSVKPGHDYAGAPQLQRLLQALGDATASPGGDSGAPQSLTPPLVAALKKFQTRHGEKADGVLGSATYSNLTTPLALRARQIELTMERWRWLPSEWVGAPIIVNIPQFRLYAFDSTVDSEAHIRQMDVIVGKPFEATQTPVFSADMTYLIFRPYWEVPYSIARKEIVPGARVDPASIAKHQMQIVRGGGDSAVVMPNTVENVELVARGALRLRQMPGPDNSLGLVKFMLPNPYNVYLHSTPARALFAESRRDFSHGCVRVSDPVGLAEYVLRDSPEWTRAKIEAAMNGSGPLTVTLKHRIRVFFVYGTALATESGEVFFFDDIYGHDRRLEAALDARRPRPAPAAPAAER